MNTVETIIGVDQRIAILSLIQLVPQECLIFRGSLSDIINLQDKEHNIVPTDIDIAVRGHSAIELIKNRYTLFPVQDPPHSGIIHKFKSFYCFINKTVKVDIFVYEEDVFDKFNKSQSTLLRYPIYHNTIKDSIENHRIWMNYFDNIRSEGPSNLHWARKHSKRYHYFKALQNDR